MVKTPLIGRIFILKNHIRVIVSMAKKTDKDAMDFEIEYVIERGAR